MIKQFLCLTLACSALLSVGCSAGNVQKKNNTTAEHAPVVVERSTQTKADDKKPSETKAEDRHVSGRVKKRDGMKLTIELAEISVGGEQAQTPQDDRPGEAPNKKQGEAPSGKPGEKPGEKPQNGAPKGDKPQGEKPQSETKPESAAEGEKAAEPSLKELIFSGETKDYMLAANTTLEGAESIEADMVVILDLNEDGSVKAAKVIDLTEN